MRILHIVTLVAADGAFGGPAQVALAQTAALRQHGETVLLISARRGFPESTDEIAGSRVKLFFAKSVHRRLGFAGLWSVSLAAWLVKNLAKFDVVHLHLARDLIMIPALVLVRLSRKPYFVQPHGMLSTRARPLARILDALVIRRGLRGAQVVFALNEQEQIALENVARSPLKSRVLINGLNIDSTGSSIEVEGRQVLFLARLHPRKQPMLFTEMAIELASDHRDVTFHLAGPDEGERAAIIRRVHDAGLADRIILEGAISPALVRDRMSQAVIYVLPARDEPFGLTVLEALSVGVPVVVAASGGLAPVVEEYEAGLVTDGNLSSLKASVSRLLSDEVLRREMGDRGRLLVRENFDLNVVKEKLLSAYEESINPPAAKAKVS